MAVVPRARRAGLAGLVVLLPALGATSCAVPDAGTPAGGRPPALVLTMGTDDPQGRPASNQIVEFARQVDRLSGGAVRIEPRFQAAGQGHRSWDQRIDRMVVRGSLDLAVVPARSWDTEGVRTLRALSTPLLITSRTAMNTVVSDDGLSQGLLAGLRGSGATGLALLPEGIRYLVALREPEQVLDRLARGGTVRSPRSDTVYAFLQALGARPTDAEPDASMVAAETELALVDTLGQVSSLLGNLPLFPKVNTLVVNTERYQHLTARQRDVLREAAAATRDWAVGAVRPDVELARSYCADGGLVEHVGERDLHRARRAAAQVEAVLREDAATATLIDRLRTAIRTDQQAGVPRCTVRPVTVAGRTIRPEGGILPDGLYRFQLTDAWLRAQGLDTEQVHYNHGTWTITLSDGSWHLEQVAADLRYTESNIYQVRGHELFWKFDGDDFVFHARWSLSRDGTLHFVSLGSPKHFMFTVPWRRIR